MTATKTIRLVGTFAGMLVAAGLAAGAARADEAQETMYKDYHGAIEAAKLCEDRSFDQPAHGKMARVIDEKINYGIGAGRRLTLIEQAKSEVYKLVWNKGCASAPVGRLLALFHAELEPAL